MTNHATGPDFIRRPPARFGEVRVDNLTQIETLDRIDAMIGSGGAHRMVVVNASKLTLAETDDRLRRILQTSDLVTADGMSVVWASRLSKKFGGDLVERVTGIDTMIGVCERAASTGRRVYLCGAKPGVAELAARNLVARFPGLQVAGCRDGYFTDAESPSVAEAVRQSGADVLFLALGSPKQEYWLEEFGPLTGVSFCLGVGGSFDHVAGLQKRAPRWMQRAGLEWAHRFAREPRRLWRRYLIGNALFVRHLVEWRFK